MTYENYEKHNKYLFVVCMNSSGSTLLHYYLEKCKLVASLPRIDSDIATSSEGQGHVKKFLPQNIKNDLYNPELLNLLS